MCFGVGLIWVLVDLVWVLQKELRLFFCLQFPFNRWFGFPSHVSVGRLCVCVCVCVSVCMCFAVGLVSVLVGLVWVWQKELQLTVVWQFPFNN